jgi:6-phosphogluconolactonase
MLTRRSFLASSAAAAPLLAAGEKYRVYIGTYTRNGSHGIYQFTFDTATGALTPAGLAAEIENPSFLAIHPSGNFLYAAGELSKFKNEDSGALTAFEIDHATGKLKRLNDAPAGGTSTCHVNVSRNGRFLAAANYGSGSCCVYAIESDGRLGSRTAFQQHKGSSANAQRQAGPHAHSVNFDRPNRHLVVADLGLDQLLVYKFDPQTGTLSPNDPPYAKLAPGSGPRHFSFHPSGRFAYAVNEMLCTVTAFRYNSARGVLSEIETVPTLPVPVERGFSTAEILVHPTGKFLYNSNRGHNTLTAFKIDTDTGKLTRVENESTRGEIPRNFAIEPRGGWIIAANQNTSNLTVLRVNLQSGALDPVGDPVAAPVPVCVRYLRLRRA